MPNRIRCGICQTAIASAEPTRTCPACDALYHADCWDENHGCGVFGCAEAPPTEKLEDLEVPASYWGADHKACPRCHEEILAAALRCRHCGARFASDKPEGEVEFAGRERAIDRRETLGKRITWLFVLALIPGAAALAGIAALWMVRREQDTLARLPALYGAALRLAALVGLAQTAFLVMVLVIYSSAG